MRNGVDSCGDRAVCCLVRNEPDRVEMGRARNVDGVCSDATCSRGENGEVNNLGKRGVVDRSIERGERERERGVQKRCTI